MTAVSDIPELRPLRPHQQVAIDELRHSIVGGHRCVMIQAPTGAGKTVIAAHIVAGAREKRKRVAFCVPSIGLIDQTFERFLENGIEAGEMGVIQADHPWRRAHAPVQICSAQTLARRSLPDVDVVLVDEAHVRYEIYDRWMAAHGYGPAAARTDADTEGRRRPIFIGLSATPWSKGLGKWWTTLVKPTSTQELIDGGYLSPFTVLAPTHPDLMGIKTVAGDFHEGELGERMGQAKLVADVVSTWLLKGNGEPTLCFCVNRSHAKKVAAQFAQAGVATAYIDANTDRAERERIGRQLATGAVKVVVNIGCCTTGIDWDVRCISLARPTKSDMLFVQIIGRGLRTAPGKDRCIILDHSDTTLRLGFVTDIDHDTLDDGKAKKSASDKDQEDRQPLPRACGSCTALVPARMAACQECGAEMVRPTNVQVADGELVELQPGGRTKREKPAPLVERLRAMGKPSVIGQLYAMRDERNRSDGWVSWKFKEIFDVWPRGLDRAPALEPTNEMRAFIRQRAIAYAKAMAKRERGEAAA